MFKGGDAGTVNLIGRYRTNDIAAFKRRQKWENLIGRHHFMDKRQEKL